MSNNRVPSYAAPMSHFACPPRRDRSQLSSASERTFLSQALSVCLARAPACLAARPWTGCIMRGKLASRSLIGTVRSSVQYMATLTLYIYLCVCARASPARDTVHGTRVHGIRYTVQHSIPTQHAQLTPTAQTRTLEQHRSHRSPHRSPPPPASSALCASQIGILERSASLPFPYECAECAECAHCAHCAHCTAFTALPAPPTARSSQWF